MGRIGRSGSPEYAPKLEILERDVLPRFPTALRAAASELVGQLPPPPPIE